MKWLIQEFLNSGSNIRRVSAALDNCHTPYLLVRLNTDHSFTVIDKESHLPFDNSDKILSDFIKEGKVMVYGSKAFAETATKMGLTPGSFSNEKFVFDVFRKELGEELLNFHFVEGELLELKPIAERFFIRPTGNTKLFTGKIVTAEEFQQWQRNEKRVDSPYKGQTLILSPVQEILAEYRFFVVSGETITSSHYQVDGFYDTQKEPSWDLVQYANEIIRRFPLAEAYVLDIAETTNGFKVVEYNNINSSGLYGCSELAFVQAINRL